MKEKHVYLDPGHGGLWGSFYRSSSGYLVPGFQNGTPPNGNINDPDSEYFIPDNKRIPFLDDTTRWYFDYHSPSSGKTIRIAHGSSGSTAVHDKSIHEQALNYKMSKELKNALGNPYRTYETRRLEGFVDLRTRWTLANKYFQAATHGNAALRKQHVFVSIHCDAPTKVPDENSGFEIYLKNTGEDPTARQLANKIQASILAHFERDGISYNRSAIKKNRFLVLTQTSMPAVLIETGFLNNRYDVERLVDDSKRTALITAIRDGIDSHFGYRRKPGDEKIKLSGHVIDGSESTKFLADIFVVAEQVGITRTVKTDKKGRFEFDLPKFGKWQLFFSDPREKYLRNRIEINVECFNLTTNNVGLERNPVIVVPPINPPPVEPPPPDSNVFGTVVAENSVPIKGARVSVFDEGGKEVLVAESQSDGNYKFKIIKSQNYDIVYTHKDFETQTINKLLGPGTTFDPWYADNEKKMITSCCLENYLFIQAFTLDKLRFSVFGRG